MEDYRDVESYLKAGLIYAKEDQRPPLVIVSIQPMYTGKEIKFYLFDVDGASIALCKPENLYEHMQLVKKRYNEDGKAVLFA